MKRILYFIAILPFIMGISSCEKKDCNGDLDGMWQLLEWKDPEGVVVATKEDMIFYSVQLQMMNFKKLTPVELNYNSSFRRTDDGIQVYDPIKYIGGGHDQIMEMSVLEPVGVPADGIMRMEGLSSQELVLNSPTRGTLKFRKY